MPGTIKTEDASFVVPVIDFSRNVGSSSGSWVARNIVKDTEGKDVSLYMNSMYHQESPDAYYAIGICIKGGIGSPDQPYSFDVVLSPKPLVNVSIEFGAGHGELATAVASALPDYMQAIASGTTTTMKYPAIDDDVKTHKFGTVLTYIKDQVLAKLTNKKDNNELFLVRHPRP